MELKPGMKVVHDTFGKGSFVDYQDRMLVINFESVGKKRLTLKTLHTGILKVLDQTDHIVIEEGKDIGDSVQFDSSKTKIGDNNVAAAICTDKKVIFNESYTLVGGKLQCSDLYACYDLTVDGDVEVDSIDVKGRLTVLGNIKASEINCSKTLICQGDIEADDIVVGDDIVADNIKCKNMDCTGNVLARTTIDISENLGADKSVVAGEGIIGEGEFRSQNAIAAEYFEFDGKVKSKIIDLSSHIGIDHGDDERDLENIISAFRNRLKEEITDSMEQEEDVFVECICELSRYDQERFSEWAYLLKRIVNEIAYLGSITNFKDYLFTLAAKLTLPEEILTYETIEHVFEDFLPECVNRVKNMEYSAKDIKEFAYSLYVVDRYAEELNIGKEEALDKIFQSIGLKYKTVKQFIKK